MAQPIAIVGIATELPSGDHSPTNLGHDEFFQFLMEKKDSYVRIPEDRLNIDAWAGRGLGQIIAERGSFLKDIGLFDPTEFGITAKDARAMAVSTRKLIELAFLALLDAGIDYRGRNVGCYASATAFDMQSIAEPDEMEPRGSLAGIPCMIANKISYHLDLRGPSVPVDTACSSSAVALHLAVQAIRSGECDAAVVAGCQLNLRASDFALYTQASILSPDGRCKPFDAGGNGFSRGEGAAVAILKPLDQALKDGDHIYGTILGTGISSCGSLAPVNAPVAEAQANAMERAFKAAGRLPAEVDFVEVHGTGTAAGDPTEANWVGARFARSSELVIGSVKGNIGHLEITSFLASMSKVVSIFEHKQVPPQVHLRSRNPAIHWDEYKLRVPMEAEPIAARAQSGNLLVSICSSGIGGVNAHAVLESYPRPERPAQGPEVTATLLIAGGLSPRSAAAVADDLKEAVAGQTDETAADYSIVYGRRARQMTWRSFAVKRPGQDVASFSQPVLGPRVKPPVAFLFSGQGPQHLHMGRQLFEAYPVFRESMLQLDACYKQRTGVSMIHDIGLFGKTVGQGLPAVWPISLILPSITAVQLALFDLLASFGVQPDVLIGHSAGETALLYASGAGSKEMALEISIARGEAMMIVEEHSEGTMAAIACSADDANRILQSVSSKYPDKKVEIACYNSPDAVALAGHAVLVDEAVALANKGGFIGRRIMTRVPVHCSLMELCETKFKALVGDVFARYPGEHRTKVTTYSTCTGDVLDGFTADYFWQNSRNAVLFDTTMARLIDAHPNPLVVEMSPHPVLASYVAEIGVTGSSIVGPMRRSKTITPYMEQTSLLNAVGQLVVAGYNRVNFQALNGRPEDAVAPRVATPAYPFAKKHVDYFPELSRIMHRQMSSKAGPLNFPDLRVNIATHPELAEHLINSEPIMPAAGFIEMGLECGAKTMWKIKFHSILALSASSPVPVQVSVDGMRYSVRSQTLQGAKFFNHDPKGLRLHADGFFSKETALRPADLDVPAVIRRSAESDVTGFYHVLEYFAQYGPSFRRVDQLFFGNREALVRIKGMGGDLARDGNYTLHPAVLDASFHVCVHPSMTKSTDPNVYYLPSGVNAINIYDAMDRDALCAEHIYAYVTFKSWKPSEIVYDVALLDMRGRYLCLLHGFSVARHYQIPVQEVSARYGLVNQPYNIPVKPSISSKSSDSGVVLDGAVEALEDRCRDVLKYVVDTCGKKSLRILEVSLGEAPILGKQLVDLLEGLGAAPPAYTIASSDTSSIAPDVKPQQFVSVAVNPIKPDSLGGLDPAAFDLICGSVATTPDTDVEAVLKHLRPLLAPGAYLVLLGPSSLNWQSLLDRAAFDQIFLSDEGDKQSDVLVQARCPALPTTLPATGSVVGSPVIVNYAVGEEMQVQEELKRIDDSYDKPIWLVASDGADADGLTGFGRTLTKEFPQWNLRLASFASTYSKEDRAFIITSYLPQEGEEREFVVEEGLRILTPRIVPLPPPSVSAFALAAHAEPLGEHELRVEVSHCSSSDTGLFGVVGKVVEASSSAHAYLTGRHVVAVVTEAPTSVARIHRSAMVRLPSRVDHAAMAKAAPALFFGGLMLGAGALTNPLRLRSRVVITHGEEKTAQVLSALCHMLDLSVTTLSSKPSPQELYALKLQSADIVCTAFEKDSQLLAGYVPTDGCIVSWRSVGSTRATIGRDPWVIHDVLNAITKLPDLASVLVPSWEPVADIATMADSGSQLFSAEKSYLLVGGMGSLGPYIALWMYQRGARHVVLTSRSGRGALAKMADLAPSLVFEYLESLSDLSLVVEAADAADGKAMAGVLNRMQKPLGGCVFLATAFDDRLFYAQDKGSFARSYSAKVGAVEALESLVDLGALDFLIGLSSATTWGNIGQTNYTCANTIMEGKLGRYRNAFSIAAPAIFNTTSMTGTVTTSNAERASHLTTWAISPEELCNCLEDGLLKLQDGPFGVYVPPLDFDVITESLGPSHLYGHMTRGSQQQGAAVDGEDLHNVLQSLVLQVVDVSADDFSAEVPLTTYGLDSLTAGRLSSALRPWITLSQMQLLGDMTFAEIEARVAKAQQPKHEEGASGASTADVAAGAAALERMISKYSIGFDADAKRPTGPLPPNSVVLITGTTGGLGSYFLAQLLANSQVSRVYAFNRPSETRTVLERQKAGFTARQLDVSLLSSSKLVFVEGDATASQLGLDKETYEGLRKSVTVIIHNAWRLDLNAPVKTFVPNIVGTRNLLDMARASPNADSIRFAFISTIGSTQNWRDLSQPVPEEIVQDASVAVMRGYGEGKYVAERLVAASGIQSSVFRVGQLSGASDTGAWSVAEWVPEIVKSSLKLGTLPDAGGVISWLPMNKTAPVVLDAVFSPDSPPAVFNVVHPRPVTWHSMMNNLATSLSAAQGRKFALVPFVDWLNELERLSATLSVEETQAIPALKLLDRLRIYAEACPPLSSDFTEPELRESGGWARLSLDKMLAFSPTLRAMREPEEMIGSEQQAATFVQYWRQQGFLTSA